MCRPLRRPCAACYVLGPDALTDHRERQEAEKEKPGKAGRITAWSSRRNSEHRWSLTTCAEAGAAKVPPHIVRDIVGHSDIEVTMTLYAHTSLDEKRKALRKLGDALD
jgi:integrase